MLNRSALRSQAGSAMVTALMVMLVVLPLGLALLAIVDTQAKDSGRERARDRAFNLADGALSSAAFSFSRYNWPSSAAHGAEQHRAQRSGRRLRERRSQRDARRRDGRGSTTAKLQPNLNASFDDSAYTGATWQINVCDDIAGSQVWDETLKTTQWNYDANNNGYVWVRSEAHVGGRKRVIAALVHPAQVPALSSKYGLMTGRLNSDVTNAAGSLLTSGLLGSVTSALLGTNGLVAADPLHAAPAIGCDGAALRRARRLPDRHARRCELAGDLQHARHRRHARARGVADGGQRGRDPAVQAAGGGTRDLPGVDRRQGERHRRGAAGLRRSRRERTPRRSCTSSRSAPDRRPRPTGPATNTATSTPARTPPTRRSSSAADASCCAATTHASGGNVPRPGLRAEPAA